MEHAFWLERWQKGEIGFHRDVYHAALDAHWDKLGAPAQSTVFVPLCGKSLDMEWLARRGHRVIGVELSDIAIDAFFESQGLKPTERQAGDFLVKSAGPYEIWCGDIFTLPQSALESVAAVYDRASMVAFEPAMQPRYAQWLASSLGQAPILLVALDFDQSEMSGPPFSVPEARIDELFAGSFAIERLSRNDALDANGPLRKRGLTGLSETVHLLRKSK